jgi:hypothetical protein
MVRPGKLPRRFILHQYRPMRISPSLLSSALLSVTFVPSHLCLHRLLEVRGFYSPALLQFISLPSFVTPNGGFFFLLFFVRRFLWDRLLSTNIFMIRFLVAQYLTTLDCSVPSICIHRCSGVYFCLFFTVFFYIRLLLLDPALSAVSCLLSMMLRGFGFFLGMLPFTICFSPFSTATRMCLCS